MNEIKRFYLVETSIQNSHAYDMKIGRYGNGFDCPKIINNEVFSVFQNKSFFICKHSSSTIHIVSQNPLVREEFLNIYI